VNIFSTIYYFYQRKIQPGFRVGKTDLVVDIGSGDKPFWRGDVFVDKLSLGNAQRDTQFGAVRDVGKFVDSDVTHMPFHDKAFDFSFCSHLLEHVDDPAAVIKEITRVSRAGYLEVPNGLLETIRPFRSHLWFVYWAKNKLVFVRKSKKMHEVLSQNGITYDAVLGQIPSPFIRLYWKGTIPYEVINPLTPKEQFESIVGDIAPQPTNAVSGYMIMVKVLRLLFYIEKHEQKFSKIFKKATR
jgi:SAM-dependent methyltransferase